MSWQRPILNKWLALTERPLLAREQDIDRLRRSFVRKARLFFHGPRGTQTLPGPLGGLHLVPRGSAGRRIFYIHGGAFVMGAPETHAAMAAQIGRAAQADVVLPRYPLAPEHPFPAALEGLHAAWRAEADAGLPLVLGGDSAGGCLALALLAQLLASGGPLPRATFALSPVTDLTFSGASFAANDGRDVVLPASRARDMVDNYVPGGPPTTDPRVSPLFADFNGAPPVWLTVGDTEILLDDTRRIAARLETQGVPVTCKVQRDVPHVWPLFHNFLPEARQTTQTLGAWIKRQTPHCES